MSNLCNFISNCGSGTSVGAGCMTALSDDESPALGGNLSLNGHSIGCVTATELGYLCNVSSDIQLQLDQLAIDVGLTEVQLDKTPCLGGNLSLNGFSVGHVSPQQFDWLRNITSDVQEQFNSIYRDAMYHVEDDTFPKLGGHLNLQGHNIDNVSSTQINYLSGLTSDVQQQLDALSIPPIFEVEEDISPKLGGDLDMNGHLIGCISYEKLENLKNTRSDIQQQIDNISSNITEITTELVTDPSPQLGGNLDMNGFNIGCLTPMVLARLCNVRLDIQEQIDSLSGGIALINTDLRNDTTPELGGDLTLGAYTIAGTNKTEIQRLQGVTAPIQEQLDDTLKNIVDDSTPQLGGNLDLNGKSIGCLTSTVLGFLCNVTSDVQHQLDMIETDLVHDLTPQLGGNLDLNGKNINGITPAIFDNIAGTTGNIQTQLNELQIEVGEVDTDLLNDTTPQLGGNLDFNGFSVNGITPTIFANIGGTTSNIQAQLDDLDTSIADINTYLSSLMTDLESDTSPALGADLDLNGHNIGCLTPVTLSYLCGVTSDVQSQFDGKVSKTGDVMTGSLDMASNKITSTYTPMANVDLTNKEYVDAKVSTASGSTNASLDGKVDKAGDVMSGALDMGVSKVTSSYVPLVDVDLTNKRYVDAEITTVTASAATVSSNKVDKAGDTMTGMLNMGSNKVTSSYVPNIDIDLTNKLYVDSEITAVTLASGAGAATKVDKSGDTMTGALEMGTNYVATTAAPSAGSHLTNKDYVDGEISTVAASATTLSTNKVDKSGDTMTGTLNMGVNQITSTFEPVDNGDVTNKLYVDTAISNYAKLDKTINSEIFQIDGEAVGAEFGAVFGLVQSVNFNPTDEGIAYTSFKMPRNLNPDEDIKIKVSYSISSGSGNIKFDCPVWCVNHGQTVNESSPTLTLTETISGGTAGTLSVVELTSVIPSSEVSNTTELIIFKMVRDAANAGDTHTGSFQITSIHFYQ